MIAVLHASISPVNGNALKCLDSTYDLLCALASGMLVISNGHGLTGEWVGRFYKTFASGSIYSFGRLMQETIEKKDKMNHIKKSIQKSIANEFNFEKTCEEIFHIFKSLSLEDSPQKTTENSLKMMDQIEEMVKAKQYLDAIQMISCAFQMKDLGNVQKANLFRLIGDCFTKLGDPDNGVSNYTRAIEMDPYCAKSFIGLGTVALQRSNYNIAVPQFQKAVTLAPNDDMASLGLGLAFEGLGEMRESLRWTARACHLSLDNTVAIYNLVKLSYELNEYEEAQKALTRYLQLHPHDVNMIYTLGGIDYKVGNIKRAYEFMENILLLDPMNAKAHGLMAQIQRLEQQKRPA